MIETTLRRIRNNFSYLLMSEIAVRGMMLILTINLAKTYGPEQFGVYALALSVGGLFEIIFNLGIGTIFMQRAAAETTSIVSEMSKFLPLRMILSSVSFICLFFFVLFLGKDTETFYSLLVVGFYFGLSSIASFPLAVFDAGQRMQYGAVVKLVKFIVIFALGMLLVFQRQPIHRILLTYVAGTVLTLPIIYFSLQRHFPGIRFKADLKDWKQIIFEGWPVALSGTFVFVYNYLDTIIISLTRGEAAVGLYHVSYKIIGTLFILSALINQAHLPPLIRMFKSDPRKSAFIFNRALENVFFWSIPLTFGGLMLAERIILFIFGNDYIGAIAAFKILIWNCIIFFLSSALATLLYALRKQRDSMIIFFFGAVANTVLNIIVIPRYGIVGAALTTVVAEMLVLAGMYVVARRLVRIEIFRSLLPALISGLCMSAALRFIRIDSLIVTIAIGGLIYMGIYFAITGSSLASSGKLLRLNPERESLPKDLP